MRNDEHHESLRRACESRGIAWPRCGFEVGPGWLPIVERALDEMIAAGWDRHLEQVKQKFCQLRIYIGRGSDDVYAAIERAAGECDRACEECGQPHYREVPSVGRAVCEVCRGLSRRGP